MRIAIIDQSPVFKLGLKAVIREFSPGAKFFEADSVFSIDTDAPAPHLVFLSLDEIERDPSKMIALGKRLNQSAVIGTISSQDRDGFQRNNETSFIIDIIPKTAPLEHVAQTCARAVKNAPYANKTELFFATPDNDDGQIAIRLPPRHLETLKHLSDGRSNQQIAEHMSISVNTVRIYVSAILRSLNASNRTQAALIGQKILKKIQATAN